jgi:alkylation response protein AidB-like acyl-CoA dehydrogenase
MLEMLDRVESLQPLIAQHAPKAEADRRLTAEVYAALDKAGLFAMLVPEAYGGMQMYPVDVYRVWEALGRIDTAAAWNVVMNGGLTAMAAWLPQAGADQVFANGPTTIAGALNPPCAAVRDDGGWRITGQVPFASGCDHAKWFLLPGMEMDGAEPKLDPVTGQPTPMAMFLPRADATVLDTWHTLGMRGSGSADVAVHDAFVPDELVFPVAPLTSPNPAFDGPTARMFPLHVVHGESVVSIAAAATMVDQLVGLAERKTPSYTLLPLRERELAQCQAGRARALVDASREYLHKTGAEGFAEAATGSLLSSETKIRMQLAGCFAAEACAEAGRLVHAAAGASAIRTELGFERLFRDLHTLSQHASKALPRYGSAGRLMFGLENDWIFLSLLA